MTIDTKAAPLTAGHTDNRFAVLRSIVEGEWMPAPVFDTRTEADSYARGFGEACEVLGTGASVLVLDLSTGKVDDLDTIDEDDYDALLAFVAEAFGIHIDGEEVDMVEVEEDDEPSQEEIDEQDLHDMHKELDGFDEGDDA